MELGHLREKSWRGEGGEMPPPCLEPLPVPSLPNGCSPWAQDVSCLLSLPHALAGICLSLISLCFLQSHWFWNSFFRQRTSLVPHRGSLEPWEHLYRTHSDPARPTSPADPPCPLLPALPALLERQNCSPLPAQWLLTEIGCGKTSSWPGNSQKHNTQGRDLKRHLGSMQ